MNRLLAQIEADVRRRRTLGPGARRTPAFMPFAAGLALGLAVAPVLPWATATATGSGHVGLEGLVELQATALQRLQRIHRQSARYQIPADLAAAIEDIARSEGLDPDLAFRLVAVESGFRGNAVSPKGAIGYTQILPTTARLLDPRVTDRDLFERDTNLRLGFRFLRYLLDVYGGDVALALDAYHRGPAVVDRLRATGRSAGRTWYVRRVLRGARTMPQPPISGADQPPAPP